MKTVDYTIITAITLSLIFTYALYFLINYYNQKEIIKDIKRTNFLLQEEIDKLLALKKPINLNVLSNIQQQRFNTWKNQFKPLPNIGATGGHFGIDVTFTSIGCVVIAYNWKGDELDLTEYEKL